MANAPDVTLHAIGEVRELHEFEATYKKPEDLPSVNARMGQGQLRQLTNTFGEYWGNVKSHSPTSSARQTTKIGPPTPYKFRNSRQVESEMQSKIASYYTEEQE
ncbi:hypothetical protein MHU86_4425 [Fragilaria crotonensis]|nr:hypothetical protein MHU86_21480 [Fragilaria crotonensis]KAI2509999.1 hypothetical protein MHU86_4425 [Fragilaria crotonensis]